MKRSNGTGLGSTTPTAIRSFVMVLFAMTITFTSAQAEETPNPEPSVAQLLQPTDLGTACGASTLEEPEDGRCLIEKIMLGSAIAWNVSAWLSIPGACFPQPVVVITCASAYANVIASEGAVIGSELVLYDCMKDEEPAYN